MIQTTFIIVVWLMIVINITARKCIVILILFLYLFHVSRYMKYLYPYECEKRRLSTPGELQAAIDGNRREGRRGSYGTYAEMMQRSPSQMSPLSLVTAARPQVNGNAGNHHHANNNHLPHHQALLPPSIPGKLQMLLATRNSFLSNYFVCTYKNIITANNSLVTSDFSRNSWYRILRCTA